MENITVKASTKEGKVKAHVTVKEGRLAARFTLVEVDGSYYLNPTASFFKNLKGKDLGNGRSHTGFIENAYITDADFRNEVIAYVLKDLGLLTEE